MNNPIVKRVIWICIFAVLVYSFFFIWTDFKGNLQTLRQFPWGLRIIDGIPVGMPIILLCVLVNFLIRELKWDYFRRAAGIDVPRFGSFLVFFSGFSMAISPGRIGELIKPFMYKEYFGQKMRRTVPLVLCERVSDLLGMILLAVLTVWPYMSEVQESRDLTFSPRLVGGFLILSIVFMVVLIWLARQKRWAYQILIQLSRFRRLRGHAHKMRKMYFATYPLLTLRNLAITTAMGTVSWSFECVALWLILKGVQADVSLLQATFIFCMATIFGGFLFFLPGGLGGFEPSMILLLNWLGVSAKRLGTPATFIVRMSTLFFGVALGFIFILITSLKYHKRMMWDAFQHVEELPEE